MVSREGLSCPRIGRSRRRSDAGRLARQQGQAAHSPELTAAAGWLAAVVVLGILGDDLALALSQLVRGSLTHPAAIPADPAAVVAHVRGLHVLGLAWPLGAILAGFAGGRAGCAPVTGARVVGHALIVPDLARLWTFSSGPGLALRTGQSSWSMVKAIVLVAAAAWTIRAGWSDLLRLSDLEGPSLARAAGADRAPPGLGAGRGAAGPRDWSTMRCGTGDSRRCCGRRPSSSAKIGA